MQIDYARDALLTEFGLSTLKASYLVDGETSPQQAFARAAQAFADNDAHAQRLYDYSSKLWFMFATPVLSNGGTKRGLPISCYLNYVDDSRDGITKHYTETSWLASVGGGVGGYWGDIRSDGMATSNGSKSNGSIPFIKVTDTLMAAFNQGTTRRGAYAAYQDISHPEIEEFIDLRDPSGDHGRRCLGTGFHHGVIITDDFMQACIDNAPWDLIDPKTKRVTSTVKARDLWERIITKRLKTGEPYIVFGDTANLYLPQPLKKKGLRVRASNLCTEIFLPTGWDDAGNMRTAVCCLSSVNLAKWEEWGPVADQFIGDLIRMLDNVLQSFIDNAPAQLSWAVNSARMSRDLGLGAMGFHTLLQQQMIAFESDEARTLNNKIFSTINRAATAESRRLADERGEAPDMVGTGMHNAHLLAIAPNASSSIAAGVDPSVEPRRTNAFKQSTQAGMALNKNPVLAKLLAEIGRDTPDVWKSIIDNQGSVQHLDFLTDHQRAVFKTAFEIDQQWIVEHAATRQPWICQGQSINLFFENPKNDADLRAINQVHLSAWKKGLKSLYYVRSRTAMRANTGSATRQSVAAPALDPDAVGCTACEG
jgi:ribonucleoside-diphosphate reductase alpha chain